MATIKICDKCGTADKSVRGFRWMGLMDKNHYKHTMEVKADLCKSCNAEVILAISRILHYEKMEA